MRQHVARVFRAGRIDRHVAFVDVLNKTVFVDYKRGAIAVAAFLIEDAILLHDGAFEVAEQRKGDANLLGKLAVSGNAVHTEAENLGIGRFEFGDISLIRLHLFRSTAGESQHIKGEYNILLALKVAELVSLAIRSAQREVWRRVADFQVSFWRGWLLSERGRAEHSKQQSRHQESRYHRSAPLEVL